MSDVIERFLRYIAIDTKSSETSGLHPSTDCQKVLGRLLRDELMDLGASEVKYDEEHNYVYAMIPSNLEDIKVKTIGFISHMDTSPEISGSDVRPQIIREYDGGIIKLGDSGYVLDPEEFPELLAYTGKSLITTSGNSLLGSDDKAGIAEIMTMAQILLDDIKSGNNLYKHGPVAIAFTPDEEIGEGIDFFDLNAFGADYAYTVDGGALGELEYENFNAASANIVFYGRNVHPGDAKGKMLNSMKVAMDFNSKIPANEAPEKTSEYEGFYHLTSINGDVEKTTLEYIIRDHDLNLFQQKKDYISSLIDEFRMKYGTSSVEIEIKDQYYNMKEKIVPDFYFLIKNASEAMRVNGVIPVIKPIRGGTDGAMLSYKGLPCPNLCTGGHNFHGRFEFCCVESMEKIVDILRRLVCL